MLLLLAVTGIAIGAVLYLTASREVSRAADAQLINAARLVHIMVQDDIAAGQLAWRDKPPAQIRQMVSPQEAQAFRDSYDSCIFLVFWNGRAVAQSGSGAPVRLVPRQTGLRTFKVTGNRWRSYGMRGEDPRLLIVVAERDALREFSIGQLLRELAVPMLALLAVAMVVLWWTLRRGLYQVERLASILGARSLSDLQPLPPQEWPRDLEPLIIALNKLFARLEGAYELEQAFTDDVAHELRTPLAAIRAQAQLLHRLSPANLGHETDRLIGIADRANALIDGMLTLARLNATSLTSRSVDVHALVAEVVAEVMIEQQADTINVAVMPEHIVRWHCDASLLQIALSAVIGNAMRHAGSGRALDIAIVRGSGRLVITVGDRGPGIPEPERERLLRRFEHGSLQSSGSGLGLSVASKAMTLLNGSIRLEGRPDGPGLLVILTLPDLPR
ncbi:hypothetical protein ASE49_16945 [Novosphingobium sp. Leaf2]|nr:hypothetical protein ASE49_16945 [Novosphingobium sp. Leaf2]